ncbi:MAG: rod-binding protein [Leptospirales bacterium]|nr:rod-binding protein [Leptospirales bacterium]
MLDNTISKNSIMDSAFAAKNAEVVNRMKKETQSGPGFAEMLSNSIKRDKESEKRKLMEACHDMEAIFISKMLKEMRKNIDRGEWLHGGFAEEIFEDMLYDEYSKQMSRNSNMGLAKMLYDEMSRKL